MMRSVWRLKGSIISSSIRRRLSSGVRTFSTNDNNPTPTSNDNGGRTSFLNTLKLTPFSSSSSLDLTSDQALGKVTSMNNDFKHVDVQFANAGAFPDDGTRLVLECLVRTYLGSVRNSIMVGDDVMIDAIDWNELKGIIEEVFERQSHILLPPLANVNHLLLLFPLDPPPNEFLFTRFLVKAESTGIPFTLALSKSDAVSSMTEFFWKSKLCSWGYEPIVCSAVSGKGLQSLRRILTDQTTVIVGPSGAGKSTLIDAMKSSYEPGRTGRHKHVTPPVSLLLLSGGGYLADRPGFNEPSLLNLTKQSLAPCFPELRKQKCASRDCLHVGEGGCCVKDSWERYKYYFQLLDEIRMRDEFESRL